MRQARQHDLLGVQALRAVAALLVVAYHAVDQWTTHRTGFPPGDLWPNGSAGVDVFFVISGLVMTISVERNAHRPHAAWTFARDRLIRIVPLYWIITTFKIAMVLALPMLVSRTQLDPVYVAKSYALLPVYDASGVLRPVLPVGWTLTYEMFFYILVTAALCIRVPLERVCVPVLLVVTGLAIVGPSNGFANTIVLEFLGGIAIGRGLVRLQTVPTGWAAVVGVIGFALLVTLPLPDGRLRPLIWGVPAAALVASVVAAEMPLRRLTPRWLLAAGNASYATYLTHGFVVPAVFLVVGHLVSNNPVGLALTIILSLVAGAAAGQITHAVLEQPMMLRLRTRRAVSTLPAPG